MYLISKINHFDQNVLEYLFSLHNPFYNDFFSLITWAGSTEVVIFLTVVLVIWLVTTNKLPAAYMTLIIMIGSTVTTNVLKIIVARPRPFLAPYEVSTFSFPSGHATGALALYGVITYIVLRYQPKKIYRYSTLILTITLIALVGFSRVYLGFHYLSDVLAGYTVASVWLLGTTLFFRRHRK